jgi:hypothetical protein
MTMRLALGLLLGLAPIPGLAASFDCAIQQQCGGGTCEPFEGGPFLVEEIGDIWRISSDGQSWDGYATTTIETAGELSIVIPPKDGLSGLVSIYPSGEILFTAHAYGDGAVAITGMGNCAGEGG